MSIPFRVLASVLIAWPMASSAEPAETLPVIEVVYSRLPATYQVEGAIERRLTRADIDNRAATSTVDLLQSMPGVDAMRAGGAAGLTFVSIHGGDPNFTLFTLDGVKLNDPTNSRGGGLDLYLIPQHVIESVELSTRPASAITGSDGLSGTVSVRTRHVDGIELRGDLDSADSRSGSVAIGGKPADGVAATLLVGRDDKRSGAEADRLQQSFVLARATADPTDRLSLNLVMFHNDGDASSFPEDSGGDRLAVIRTPELRDFRLDVYGLNAAWDVSGRAMLKGAANWSSHRESSDHPGIAAGAWDAVPAVSGSRTFERFEGQLYLVAEPLTRFSATAGIAYDHERGASDDLIDFGGFTMPARFRLERSMKSVFGEIAHRPTARLTWQAGLRYDMPEGFDDEASLNAGIAYLLPVADATLSLNYGEGYKLPSMFALGHSLVGNPNLTPEYSKSLEVGLRKRWDALGVEAGLSLFRNEYRDLVDFDPLLFTNVNRGLVEAEGVDGRLTWQVLPGATADLHFTYSNADIVGGNTPLRRRPDWKGGARFVWHPDSRFSWVTNVDYTGTFFDSSIVTGYVEMPAFWRVDTALNWQVADETSIALGVRNLLDDDYEESVGFANGGITVTVGVTVTI